MIRRAILTVILVCGALPAVAGTEIPNPVLGMVRAELGRKFPGARVELYGEINWTRGFADEGRVFVEQITPRSEAVFSVTPRRGAASEGVIRFSAIVPARVALKRIMPGERLTPDMFATQEINMGAPGTYEYRGVVLATGTSLEGIESRQTILEGQVLLSSAVQKVPDIRRGDMVRIRLISGGLTIQATGVAEEPASMNGRLRVMTTKSKRALSGELTAPGVVEVNL